MPSNSSKIVVASGFYSFMTSNSDELQTLMVLNAWWHQLLMVFRLWWSSDSILQHKLHLLISLLSFVLPEPILEFTIYKFSSMVLHSWTNISISNWIFNTLLSSKLKLVMLNTFCSNTLFMRLGHGFCHTPMH